MKITILVGENYMADLRRRLKEYGISQAALAREMNVPPSQLSRWFNRGMTPRMHNIELIETSLLAIRKRQLAELQAELDRAEKGIQEAPEENPYRDDRE